MKKRIALTGALALVLSIFTAPAAMAVVECEVNLDGDTFNITSSDSFELTIWIDSDDEFIYFDHETGGPCDEDSGDISTTDLTDVVIDNDEGDVVFLLEDGADADIVAEWADLTFEVATLGDIVFDGSALSDRGASVSVGSRGFDLNDGEGEFDASGVQFIGSDFGDRFSAATYFGDVDMYGGEGNDTLTGGEGDDSIDGGEGTDSLEGGTGDDDLEGGDGGDTISASGGSDSIDGGKGNDKLYGGSGADDILGGVGNDKLWGGGGNDDLRGNGGLDTVTGGNGRDICVGETKVTCERTP